MAKSPRWKYYPSRLAWGIDPYPWIAVPRVCIVSWPGLSTFAEMLRGRNCHIWSDNTAAQHNTAKGRAKSFDHCALIHGIWFVSCHESVSCALHSVCHVHRAFALEAGIGLYVSRVASKSNIADDPSRERQVRLPPSMAIPQRTRFPFVRYSLLASMGAKRLAPQMDKRFMNPKAWELLRGGHSVSAAAAMAGA